MYQTVYEAVCQSLDVKQDDCGSSCSEEEVTFLAEDVNGEVFTYGDDMEQLKRRIKFLGKKVSKIEKVKTIYNRFDQPFYIKETIYEN
jgi:hypothetical protein